MDYQLKIKIQNFISRLPNPEKINYFLQKFVTKSLPIPLAEFKIKLSSIKLHFDNIKKYGVNEISDSVYYEIGAGYDMAIPIGMSLLGFRKLICVDVRKLVFEDLLNDTLRKFRFVNDPFFQLNETQKNTIFTKHNSGNTFEKNFNIYYLAPFDARNTKINENSIDYCITNAVLEHVPEDIIYELLKETFRVMKKGGIMSNVIDYRDHFAYFDSKINFYNYLQFSKQKWGTMNPDVMHQNRMRHKDYIKIVHDVGFEIVKEVLAYPDDVLFSKLKEMYISEEYFNSYTLDELKILGSQLVLRKP